MIIFKDGNYYSVENIKKINVISESVSGRIWIHMHTFYRNPVPVLINKEIKSSIVGDNLEKSVQYRTVNLYTSPQRNFDIRRGMDNYSNTYQFLFFPIAGNFVLEGELLKTRPDSYYVLLCKDVAFSRRYITEDQLREIRRYSLYNVDWEYNRYVFCKLDRLDVSDISFKFKFFNKEKMKDVWKSLKWYIFNVKCSFFLKKEVEGEGQITIEEITI
jgi:hypothetical protein